MKILIAEKITMGHYGYRKALEEIAGQWVDVETEYLFSNQYNVTTPSGKGIRVMQAQVRGVMDDAREGKQKCQHCYGVSPYNGLPLCPHCGIYGHTTPFQTGIEHFQVEVNRNWTIQYSTQFGSITPYDYAEVTIIHEKTGERFRAQKWEKWSSLHIEKKVPQVVKTALRTIFSRYKLDYRTIHENSSYVERNY